MGYMSDAEQDDFNGSCLDDRVISPTKIKRGQIVLPNMLLSTSLGTTAMYRCLACPKARVVKYYHPEIHNEPGKSAKATSLNITGAQAVVLKNFLFLSSSPSYHDSLWDSPNEHRRTSAHTRTNVYII